MDVLYYIGSGSLRQNIELRMSLRSLEKHGKNIDRVFLVGNKPDFIKNVEYIWVDDKYEWWRNAFEKTKAAIKAGISDEFLLMNDDFFMLGDFDAATYPYYHKGEMPEGSVQKYGSVVANTKKVLQSIGATTKHFGVHCPMRIEGKKYLELEKFYHTPVLARCLYGNLYAKGARKVNDNKGETLSVGATKCWSSRNWLQDDALKELKELFPQPSKWEKDNV